MGSQLAQDNVCPASSSTFLLGRIREILAELRERFSSSAFPSDNTPEAAEPAPEQLSPVFPGRTRGWGLHRMVLVGKGL